MSLCAFECVCMCDGVGNMSDICQSARQDQSVICHLLHRQLSVKAHGNHDWSRQGRNFGGGSYDWLSEQEERLGACFAVFSDRCFVLVRSLTFSSQLKQQPT